MELNSRKAIVDYNRYGTSKAFKVIMIGFSIFLFFFPIFSFLSNSGYDFRKIDQSQIVTFFLFCLLAILLLVPLNNRLIFGKKSFFVKFSFKKRKIYFRNIESIQLDANIISLFDKNHKLLIALPSSFEKFKEIEDCFRRLEKKIVPNDNLSSEEREFIAKEKPFGPIPWKSFSFLILVLWMSGYFLFQFKNPSEDDYERRLSIALSTNSPIEARGIYLELLEKNPEDIGLHYNSVENFFNIPVFQGKVQVRFDYQIVKYYEDLIKRRPESNAAKFGQAYASYMLKDYQLSSKQLSLIVNEKLFYVNYLKALLAFESNDYEKARFFLNSEIKNGGAVCRSSRKIMDLDISSGQIQQFISFYPSVDEGCEKTSYDRQFQLFKNGIPAYISNYFKYSFKYTTWPGLMAAFIILAIWFFYISGLLKGFSFTVLEKLFFLICGVLSAVVSIPLYDLVFIKTGMSYDSGWLSAFKYTFLAVAPIEEVAKISFPLLVLFFKPKFVDEEIKITAIGCLSGLGFATLENVIYFHENGYTSILGRSLSSTAFHMATTAFFLNGLYKFDGKLNFRIKPEYVLIPVFAHALYDYFIISPLRNYGGGMLAFLVLILAVKTLTMHIKNGLQNGSKSKAGAMQSVDLLTGFMYGLGLLFGYNFILLSWSFGSNAAIKESALQLYSGVFFFLILVPAISRLILTHGKRDNLRTAFADFNRRRP